jgi:hypothetical protein
MSEHQDLRVVQDYQLFILEVVTIITILIDPLRHLLLVAAIEEEVDHSLMSTN